MSHAGSSKPSCHSLFGLWLLPCHTVKIVLRDRKRFKNAYTCYWVIVSCVTHYFFCLPSFYSGMLAHTVLSPCLGQCLLHCWLLNPYLTNEFSHRYHFGESIFIFRGVRSDFFFFFFFFISFLMKFLCANRIALDGKPRSAASHLGLCCLPMSHKASSQRRKRTIYILHI